jgi:hypothetical protein
MVKPKVESETKNAKFKRIASARTTRILEIFAAIEKEMKRTKSLFNKPKTEFSLD